MESRRDEPARETRAPTPSRLTSNGSFKALHSALLRSFPVERVRDFWRPSLPLFPQGTEAELFEHLWDDTRLSPDAAFSDASRRFERFFWENGMDAKAGVDAFLAHANRGTYLRAREYLKRVQGVLPKLFYSADPHRAVLDMIAANATREFGTARVFYDEVEADGALHTALGLLDTGRPGLTYDANLFAARLLQLAPVTFGLPPFEGPVFHLTDCRSVDEALWGEETRLQGGVLYIGSQPYGRVLKLSAFLRRIRMSPPPWKLSDPPVVAILEDYVCPLRKRIVLHAGCAFGAPVSVARFRWRPVPPNPDQYLAALARDLTSEDSAELALVDQKQRELLALVRRVAVLTYRRERDAILLDGATLFSGVSARILLTLVRRYLATGTETFEFRDFKYDPAITNDPKRSSFETRLSRIVARLDQTSALRIQKLGRGKLRFVASVPIELREEP